MAPGAQAAPTQPGAPPEQSGGPPCASGPRLSARARHGPCFKRQADYVTEKLFHAFAAGCVPVYYGTRDVSKVLPHARAAVQVLDHPDVPSLARELATIAATPGELQARLAWRDDAAAVDAWWRRLRNATAAATTATKPQHFCSVCEAVRAVRARDPGKQLPPSRRPPSSAWAVL